MNTEHGQIAVLSELGTKFDSASFNWQLVRQHGLVNCCVKPPRVLTCGKILSHALNKITAFREKLGVRICVFKIGVTSNPVLRFVPYLQSGFTDMWVVTSSNSVDTIHMLEAACISHFSPHVGCRNKSESGGEGALNRVNVPDPPFFLYVTGGRADQLRRVG